MIRICIDVSALYITDKGGISALLVWKGKDVKYNGFWYFSLFGLGDDGRTLSISRYISLLSVLFATL